MDPMTAAMIAQIGLPMLTQMLSQQQGQQPQGMMKPPSMGYGQMGGIIPQMPSQMGGYYGRP